MISPILIKFHLIYSIKKIEVKKKKENLITAARSSVIKFERIFIKQPEISERRLKMFCKYLQFDNNMKTIYIPKKIKKNSKFIHILI